MMTMRIQGCAGVMLGIVGVLAVAAVCQAEETKASAETNRVVLSLTDGTRLVCVPEADKIPVETTYAKFDIPLAKIKTVTFDKKEKGGQADLVLKNGDKLRGKIAMESLKVKTSFGNFTVAVAHMDEIAASEAEPKKTTADSPENRAKCVNNLRLIDHAKEVVAIKRSLVTGGAVTPADISPYIDGGYQNLKCPSGGIYKLNLVDTPPECSIPGHKYNQE